ncbi:hypothetical protein WA1_42280 [Scytonema hofmannii PCC 7110]|uniref:Uncharacterized protein n=1 Tax=Scytonema hofmannii PCC 7110 TaxID=128403 RepID=A0A139WV94_9CYAN|nr:hypothetical protein [Scytonema hofmannii]KYC36349.1 hypothetical protein WA1_42280 [Scytonema hofmannii PCC 7110]
MEPLVGEAIITDWIVLDSPRQLPFTATSVKKSTIAMPESIVEADGWVLNEKGEVVLTANPPSARSNTPWRNIASCHAG